MVIDLDDTDRTPADIYRLAITFVTPRPIALVSTVSSQGIRNLAPFSFYNMVSANPPILMFCPARNRDGKRKDTLRNIEDTGEFVVATVTDPITEMMNQASADYPPAIDEFEAAGFAASEAVKIKPSLVANSPVNCECTLDRIIDYGNDPGAGAAVFGRILVIHIDDAYLAADGLLDPKKLQTIGRMGRSEYCRTTEAFHLSRPPTPDSVTGTS